MAGPSKLPEKRQASLTSFFTINGLSKKHAAAPAGSAAKDPEKGKKKKTAEEEESDDAPAASTVFSASKFTRKRPLQEDSSNGNGSASGSGNRRSSRAAKRPRSIPDDDDDGDYNDAGDSSNVPSPPAKEPPRRAPVVPTSSTSSRTELYAYKADRSAVDDGDNEDAAVARKKEELHRKFVKKLGHPDSLASLRRRGFQAAGESPGPDADDDEGGGDAEEDEPAPTTKGKKKGAKTGKLTPMEIQFLDIKRKHMDTILVVEVGYKFRFFGDDARIAAKELSIVCIPGKFRYDERAYAFNPLLLLRSPLTAVKTRQKPTSTALPRPASPFIV